MFSATYNSSVDPFTQLSSSHFHPTSTFVNDQYTTNDTLLYQLHNPLTIPLLPTNPSITGTELNMEVSSNAMMTKLDLHALNEDQYNSSNFHPGNGLVKKDRHSKIYTSRGLRDRRVRLSIEIARKFFDLQDMLGFDRASETLDWLFTKSRKAIKELAENACAKSLSSSSACEVVSDENDGLDGITSKKVESLPAGVFEDGKMKQAQKSSINLLGRESRARARARARERTRVKMTSRTLHLNESRNGSDNCHCYLNQVPRSLKHHHQECEKSGACCHSMTSSPGVVHEVEGYTSDSQGNQILPKGNVIEESMVLKRKLMKPSLGIHYQQSPAMSRGVTFDPGCSSNNNDLNMPNLAQVWDINGAVGHSSICGVSNMNLSTELQLYGKIWEAERNRCPR